MWRASRLQAGAVVLAKWAMGNVALDTADAEGVDQALTRIEQAIGRLEAAVASRESHEADAAVVGELTSRHRKLREKVTSELRQLDLLLANLPQ